MTTNLLILDLTTLFQGPLIFVVAMCRTRVAFLFKRYFCQVPMLQTSSWAPSTTDTTVFLLCCATFVFCSGLLLRAVLQRWRRFHRTARRRTFYHWQVFNFFLSFSSDRQFENIIISLFSSGAQIEKRNTTRAKEALEKDDEEGAGRRLLDRCDFDFDVDVDQHVGNDDKEPRRTLDRYV